MKSTLAFLTALLLTPLIALNAGEQQAKPLVPEQYLLLNYSASLNSAQQAQDMMSYVRDTFGAANETSRLKTGLAILYTPKEQLAETAARLRADLALAQQMEVPVLIQVDTENWLPESLTNWFDSAKPGFDPHKVHDVEWTGWSPDTAVKLCWRNWGTVVRVGPHPNLLSPRFQAWEISIYAALAPIVVKWLASLPAEKQWLFVGWKCGWETTPNSQYAYFKDGNSYLTRADNPKWIDSDKQLIGYNAASPAAFRPVASSATSIPTMSS